jgi:AAA+ superfamily predicted ATPase
MRSVYVLLLSFLLAKSVYSQCGDGINRIGALAEPKRFTFVHGWTGYYEIIPERATAYYICGTHIEIPKGEAVHVDGNAYEGSYDGYTGIWVEMLVDFDGPGPSQSTRVYLKTTDLKKLPAKPEKEVFNYTAFSRVDEAGYHVEAPKRRWLTVTNFIILSIAGLAVYYLIKAYKTKTVTPSRPYRQTEYSEIVGVASDTKIPGSFPVNQSESDSSSQLEQDESEDLDTIFSEMNSLIGLASVKREVKSLANLMRVQKMKKDAGITATIPNLHLVFTGAAGTGKTTVAQLIGRIYKQIGLLKKGHTVMVSREDLVGEYIGQTAPKTKEVIKKAIGGVLFIDEAYTLAGVDSSRDFGPEAIATLIQAMENQRGEFAVILAGYSKDMDVMLNSNQGLKSRLSNFIEFPNYETTELAQIFNKMCAERQHIVGDGVIEKVLAELEKRRAHFKENFGNAREVRTLIERIEKNQSNRLARVDGLEKMPSHMRTQILQTILPEDIKEEIYPTDGKPQRIGF